MRRRYQITYSKSGCSNIRWGEVKASVEAEAKSEYVIKKSVPLMGVFVTYLSRLLYIIATGPGASRGKTLTHQEEAKASDSHNRVIIFSTARCLHNTPPATRPLLVGDLFDFFVCVIVVLLSG